MTEQEARERAARGYEWLVTDGPRYGFDVSRIDLDTVDTGNPYGCPLKQASGLESYGRAVTVVHPGYLLTREATAATLEWGRAHGFVASPDADGWYWPLLTAAWRDIVTAARAGESATV